MPSTGSLTLNDYDGQAGIIGYNTEEVTAANMVAIATAMGNFRTAVEAVTLGLTIKSELSIIARFNASNAKASSQLAQRGNKWMVSYLDNTAFLDGLNTIPNPGYQKAFTFDIPTADLTFRSAGQDVVWDLNDPAPDADMDALATAIGALVKSPYSGSAVPQAIHTVTRSGG